MKLNNHDRESFVRAVMGDVPQTDYNTKAEQLIRAAHEKWLPDAVKTVFQDSSLRQRFLKVCYLNPSSYLDNIALYAGDGFTLDSVKGLREKIGDLAAKACEQSAKRRSLHSQVKSAIYGCNTLKQAKDLMPEFAKYLPQDRDGKVTRDVPAISNLVTDLTAAGWPKKEAKK